MFKGVHNFYMETVYDIVFFFNNYYSSKGYLNYHQHVNYWF